MKILALVHCANSHLNSCLPLFSYLKKEGHQVEICTSFNMKSTLEKWEYNYHIINALPFGSGFEDFASKHSKYPYLSNLNLRFSNYFYNTRFQELNNLVTEVKPQVILLDSLYASDTVLLYPHLKKNNIKLIYVSIMPSLDRTFWTPPINSSIIPSSKKRTSRVWKKYNLKKSLKKIYDSCRFFLHDDYNLLKERISTNKEFAREHPLVWKNIVGLRFENIPQIYLIPKEFEFHGFRSNNYQHYIGFQFFMRQETTNNTKNYNQIKGLIELQKTKGKKLIYCSFGGIYRLYKKEIVRFLNHLMPIIERLNNVFLVISLSDHIKQQIQIPHNVASFNFVPQLTMLSQSDLYITHGGINSVKEAIHFSVPMLVYPLNKKWDQSGNAARVEHHGMGLQGNIRKVNSMQLNNQINTIIKQHLHFKENIKKLNELDNNYTDKTFLNTFYNIIQGSK